MRKNIKSEAESQRAVTEKFVSDAYDILVRQKFVKPRWLRVPSEVETTMEQLRLIFNSALASKAVITTDQGADAWCESHKPSVFTLIELGHYKNAVPYPTGMIPDADRKAMRDAYHAEDDRCDKLFRSDLEEEHGVCGHQKADLLWSKAWERGHANGHHEVACVYDDLVELIK